MGLKYGLPVDVFYFGDAFSHSLENFATPATFNCK
jgi:hypothetical protein